jgi:thiamine transporter ThiT
VFSFWVVSSIIRAGKGRMIIRYYWHLLSSEAFWGESWDKGDHRHVWTGIFFNRPTGMSYVMVFGFRYCILLYTSSSSSSLSTYCLSVLPSSRLLA